MLCHIEGLVAHCCAGKTGGMGCVVAFGYLKDKFCSTLSSFVICSLFFLFLLLFLFDFILRLSFNHGATVAASMISMGAFFA